MSLLTVMRSMAAATQRVRSSASRARRDIRLLPCPPREYARLSWRRGVENHTSGFGH